MYGFYADRLLKLFNEVETEPDPNVQQQANIPNQDRQTQEQDNTTQQQNQPQQKENPEQYEQDYDATQDTIQNDNPYDQVQAPDDQNLQQNQNSSGSKESDSKVDKIKEKEEDIFSNLSPEQLDIRHKELKNQFLSMFDMTTDVVQRINNISLDTKDIPVIQYASDTLSKLRSMLTDYMNSVYKTKSYTENHINYNRFLATLNGINKILEEINKNKD